MGHTKQALGVVTAAAAMLATAVFIAPSSASALDDCRTPNKNTGNTTTISLGTHNTRHGDAEFKDFAGVIGWQEVNKPSDRRKLKNRLDDGYCHYIPAPSAAKAVAISWRVPRFQKIRAGYKKAHGGEDHVTPARYITSVVLEINSTGKRFTVINTHFISGAWNRHRDRQER